MCLNSSRVMKLFRINGCNKITLFGNFSLVTDKKWILECMRWYIIAIWKKKNKMKKAYELLFSTWMHNREVIFIYAHSIYWIAKYNLIEKRKVSTLLSLVLVSNCDGPDGDCNFLFTLITQINIMSKKYGTMIGHIYSDNK